MPASRRAVVVPGLYPPVPGTCHAVAARGLVYTAGVLPLDAQGRIVGDGDAEKQADCVFRNLDAILKALGATWGEVVRINWFLAAGAATRPPLDGLWEIQRRHAAPGEQAGIAVFQSPAEPKALLTVEAVAATDVAKRPFLLAGRPSPAGFADMVEAGDLVFLSGRAPWQPGPFAEGEFFRQCRDVYAGLAEALETAAKGGSRATLGDVIRVHQYVTRDRVELSEFRRAREPFVTVGEFVSTSVVSPPGDPERPGQNGLIKVDAELSLAAKEKLSLPDVWVNPGRLHAVRAGGLLFPQAQMAREPAGTTVFADDLAGHVDQTLGNLDGVLKAAGLGWGDVLHLRAFVKDAAARDVARAVQRKWTGEPGCPATELVAGFFDPLALYEAEITVLA